MITAMSNAIFNLYLLHFTVRKTTINFYLFHTGNDLVRLGQAIYLSRTYYEVYYALIDI